jgi:FAD/FMN-containing dehydrogenase
LEGIITTAGVDLARELKQRLAGEVIGPADPAFDRHRGTANARVDVRPRAIARCRSAEDVAGAVAVAAQRGLPLAARGGGTSDRATVDDGLVVDVSEMRGIRVDHASRTATVEPGVTWAELDEATQAHGLAVTGARVSRLGVAGVALGDGSGWLERGLGPTGASLTGAELVLANGRVLEVSEADAPDVLWGLRGGGARLGVVTRLDLRLHPVGPSLLSGFLGFPRDRAGEVAAAYARYMQEAPDAVGGGLLLGAGRGGVCSIVFCHVGTIEEGEAAIAPLRALRPSLDAVAPNEYRAFQTMWDAGNPPGTRSRVRGAFLRELSDGCIGAVLARADLPAAALSHVFLQPLGGALSRTRSDEMALRIPDADWAYHCAGLWPPVSALDPGQAAWVDGFARAMEPYALEAAYPSLVDYGSDAYAYGSDGSARLEELARRLDPSGLFRRLA